MAVWAELSGSVRHVAGGENVWLGTGLSGSALSSLTRDRAV